MNFVCDPMLIACDHCGLENKLYLKASQQHWEMCCNQCHKVNLNGLDYYVEKEQGILKELADTKKLFLHNSSEASAKKVINTIDSLASQYHKFGKCDCGGAFSISAEPRCAQCGSVVLSSNFHYVFNEENT